MNSQLKFKVKYRNIFHDWVTVWVKAPSLFCAKKEASYLFGHNKFWTINPLGVVV